MTFFQSRKFESFLLKFPSCIGRISRTLKSVSNPRTSTCPSIFSSRPLLVGWFPDMPGSCNLPIPLGDSAHSMCIIMEEPFFWALGLKFMSMAKLWITLIHFTLLQANPNDSGVQTLDSCDTFLAASLAHTNNNLKQLISWNALRSSKLFLISSWRLRSSFETESRWQDRSGISVSESETASFANDDCNTLDDRLALAGWAGCSMSNHSAISIRIRICRVAIANSDYSCFYSRITWILLSGVLSLCSFLT